MIRILFIESIHIFLCYVISIHINIPVCQNLFKYIYLKIIIFNFSIYIYNFSLKSDNILKNNGILKIADLGFAKKTKDITNTLLGTPMT